MSSAIAEQTASAPAASPVAEISIQGRVDAVQGTRVYGWAWCPDYPVERIEVEVRLGDTRLGSGRADIARPDLRIHGIGDGAHAFEITLDEPLDDARMRDLVVRALLPGGERSVPLAGRNDAEKAAEAAVTPMLARMAEWMETLRGGQQELTAGQRAALRGIRDMLDLCKAGGDGGGAGALRRITEAHQRLDEQMEAFDVFLLRFDRTLQEINAASAARKASGGGWGPVPVALVAALAAAAGAVAGSGLQAWFETLLR